MSRDRIVEHVSSEIEKHVVQQRRPLSPSQLGFMMLGIGSIVMTVAWITMLGYVIWRFFDWISL